MKAFSEFINNVILKQNRLNFCQNIKKERYYLFQYNKAHIQYYYSLLTDPLQNYVFFFNNIFYIKFKQ